MQSGGIRFARSYFAGKFIARYKHKLKKLIWTRVLISEIRIRN